MKRIPVVIIALILAAALCATGCSRKKDSAPAGARKFRIGYSTPALSNQFWGRVARGIQDAAAKNNAEIIVVDAQGDSGKQLSDIEDLATKQVDAILLSPWDTDTGGACVRAANRAGIPVIIVDIGTNGGDILSFIISDNREGGRLAGRFIAEKLGGKGKTAHIQCQLGARNAQLRGQGFEDIMKEKNIPVVARRPADSRRDLGMSVMEDILQKHPDLDAIFAQNDEMALGALRAIQTRSAGRPILVVGFDGNEDALKAIKDGSLAASVAQQPEEMGRIALETAVKSLKGVKVEKQIFVPVQLITRDNLPK